MTRIPIRVRISILVVLCAAVLLLVATYAFSQNEDVGEGITRGAIDNIDGSLDDTRGDLTDRILDVEDLLADALTLIGDIEQMRAEGENTSANDAARDLRNQLSEAHNCCAGPLDIFTSTGVPVSDGALFELVSEAGTVPLPADGVSVVGVAQTVCQRASGEVSGCTTIDNPGAGTDLDEPDEPADPEEGAQAEGADGEEPDAAAEVLRDRVDFDTARDTADRRTREALVALEPTPGVAVGRVVTLNDGRATLVIVTRQDIFAAGSDESNVDLGPAVVVMLVAATALGGVAWLALGRALNPVDSLVSEVDAISPDSLHQRVTVPKANDQLRRLSTTMNAMLDRLQHSNDRQRQFISDASHELRSPITATKATLEVARANPDKADWPEVARVLEEENERLADLVDDLLLLARLDEQASDTVSPDWVDLDELCLAEASRPHPVPVRVEVHAPARVQANLRMVTRAIRNLVDNATEHATSQVLIEVSAEAPSLQWEGTLVRNGMAPAYATVRVHDDGPGIPAGQRAWVFERFTRLEESRSRDGGGAGLGLAISYEIARAHNGALVVEDNPTGGATMTLQLPLAG